MIRILIIKNDISDLNEIYDHLKDKKDINYTITSILHDLGVPSSLKGYDYVRHIIKSLIKEGDEGIMKLYQKTAEKFGTKPECVESAIRHAIDIAWLRGNYDLIDTIFSSTISYDKSKPTNTEFIKTIVDVLELENMC